MKRTVTVLLGVLIAVASAPALASMQSAPQRARAALFHTVELRKTRAGKILVNAAGSILYEFTSDRHGTNTCVKVRGCSAIWPALLVKGRPSAGTGVRAASLSTIKLPGGGSQVTYAGHPLYIYRAAPTATSYIGANAFGGRWYALDGAGHAVK
ncbi:MAG: COG4315 family predicted lipoprotein [Solirubrobacteraceae bacterium]